MNLIYKISSVFLYDNQLGHNYVFFYNRKKDWTGDLNWDAPFFMFGSSELSASTQIYRMDKNDPELIEKSICIMQNAAKREGVQLIKNSDFITLNPIGEGRVSYGGALPGDKVETEGKYKGLKKQVYTPYDIMWNETKSGINPHEFEVMGVWNPGKSGYSSYRIWENVSEREKVIRDYKLNLLLSDFEI